MFKKAIAAALFLAALTAPQAANAQAGFALHQKDAQTCQNGREVWTDAGLKAAGNYYACPSNNLTDAATGQSFKGIRVDPGRAQAPIEIYGNCFYIDNHSDSSFFVPAATPAEWASFVQNHPQLIDLVPCCPPDVSVSDTCTGELNRSNYQRPGYTEDHMVGLFNARPVTLQCQLSANGRSAQWDLAADTSVPCDLNLANAQPEGFRTATIQGVALVRNIPID